jgi:hypothetical protein
MYIYIDTYIYICIYAENDGNGEEKQAMNNG